MTFSLFMNATSAATTTRRQRRRDVIYCVLMDTRKSTEHKRFVCLCSSTLLWWQIQISMSTTRDASFYHFHWIAFVRHYSRDAAIAHNENEMFCNQFYIQWARHYTNDSSPFVRHECGGHIIRAHTPQTHTHTNEIVLFVFWCDNLFFGIVRRNWLNQTRLMNTMENPQTEIFIQHSSVHNRFRTVCLPSVNQKCP